MFNKLNHACTHPTAVIYSPVCVGDIWSTSKIHLSWLLRNSTFPLNLARVHLTCRSLERTALYYHNMFSMFFMLSSRTRMQIHIFLTYSCENAVSKVFSVKTLSCYFFKLILNRKRFSIFLHFSYTKRIRCICYTLLSVVFYFIRIFWIDGCIAFVGLLKALIFLNNAGYSDRVGRNYGRELKEKKSRFS